MFMRGWRDDPFDFNNDGELDAYEFSVYLESINSNKPGEFYDEDDDDDEDESEYDCDDDEDESEYDCDDDEDESEYDCDDDEDYFEEDCITRTLTLSFQPANNMPENMSEIQKKYYSDEYDTFDFEQAVYDNFEYVRNNYTLNHCKELNNVLKHIYKSKPEIVLEIWLWLVRKFSSFYENSTEYHPNRHFIYSGIFDAIYSCDQLENFNLLFPFVHDHPELLDAMIKNESYWSLPYSEYFVYLANNNMREDFRNLYLKIKSNLSKWNNLNTETLLSNLMEPSCKYPDDFLIDPWYFDFFVSEIKKLGKAGSVNMLMEKLEQSCYATQEDNAQKISDADEYNRQIILNAVLNYAKEANLQIENATEEENTETQSVDPEAVEEEQDAIIAESDTYSHESAEEDEWDYYSELATLRHRLLILKNEFHNLKNQLDFITEGKPADTNGAPVIGNGKYIYCKVLLTGEKDYWYRTEDESICVSDFVTVPVGKNNTELTGVVNKVCRFNADELPLPLDKTKIIICRRDDI